MHTRTTRSQTQTRAHLYRSWINHTTIADIIYRYKLGRQTDSPLSDNLSFPHYNCTSIIYNFEEEGKLLRKNNITRARHRWLNVRGLIKANFFPFFPPFLLYCPERLMYRPKYSKASSSNYRQKASFWSTNFPSWESANVNIYISNKCEPNIKLGCIKLKGFIRARYSREATKGGIRKRLIRCIACQRARRERKWNRTLETRSHFLLYALRSSFCFSHLLEFYVFLTFVQVSLSFSSYPLLTARQFTIIPIPFTVQKCYAS